VSKGESTAIVREDLLQELTLHLWSEIALGDNEAWEIFFTRALSFAQRPVATAFMERNGYWVASNVRALAWNRHPLLTADRPL
jgi:hypothetical protein